MTEHFTEKKIQETGSTDQRHENGKRSYCSEHDRCGWTGTKPGKPDIGLNTSFNTPYIQRDRSNTV